MWTWEFDTTAGTPESQLIEALEPLWLKRRPLQPWSQTYADVHHKIKEAFKKTTAPSRCIFAPHLSRPNLHHTMVLCATLIQQNRFHHIPPAFVQRHAACLFAIAYGVRNAEIAARCAQEIAPSEIQNLFYTLCNLPTKPSPCLVELVETLVKKGAPQVVSAQTPLSACLRRDQSPLMEILIQHYTIASHDWRCAIRFTLEQDWGNSLRDAWERALSLVRASNPTQQVFQDALYQEISLLPYKKEPLSSQGKVFLRHLRACLRTNGQWEDQVLARNKRRAPFHLLGETPHPIMGEAIMELVGWELLPKMLDRLLQHKYFEAAERLLSAAPTEPSLPSVSLAQECAQYPLLSAWATKQTLIKSLPPPTSSRGRKL